MPSFQNPAPGAKSMKFQDALNPFTPFLAQPGDEPPEEDPTPLTEAFDTRLRLDASSSHAAARSQQQQQQYVQHQDQTSAAENKTNSKASAFDANMALKKQKKKKGRDGGYDNDISDDEESSNHSDDDDGDHDDGDSDDEFDYLLDDDDDDAVLQAIRQKRLRELKKAQSMEAEHKANGHGEVRTISQDEFLSECTSSDHVVVHFFHKEFEKCKIMDHHLKAIATNPKHLSCKFVRIDAEKAPFFGVKLKIKTLPTLLVFKNGQTVERLLGFEGLVSSSRGPTVDLEDFPTSRLGYWLESTGAIEYDGPESDDEDERGTSSGTRRHRTRVYDEDI